MQKLLWGILVFVLFLGLPGPVKAQAKKNDKVWKQEVSMGYNRKTGNTQSSELTAGYEADRSTQKDELTIKASTLYSSQNKKMDGQRASGSVRYAPNFADTGWFVSAKIEAEHDKFAGIDSRFLPSLGAGYWLFKTDKGKASAEVGAGEEFIKYTDGTDKNKPVLIPRVYYEHKLFKNALFSEETLFYPDLEHLDQYRLHSETRLTNPLSDQMSLRISFIEDFNSNPFDEKKKSDTQMIMSLVYSF